MDKKLLDALNNLSYALEEIADILSKKDKTAKSATTTALQSNDLDKKVTMIDKGVKQLLEDNKKILKNQETILSIAREKSSPVETSSADTASDPKKKSMIKDGLGIILMIAAGILAIGLAFKVVGGVNIGSVIAISLALPLIAIAFERIAQMKDLKSDNVKNILVVILGISAAIVGASLLLSMIKPLSAGQIVSAIFVSSTLVILSYGIEKLMPAIKGITKSDLINLPLVLLMITGAVVGSSYILSLIKTISPAQALTAVFIAATFAVISFNIKKMIDGIGDLDLKKLVLLPLVLIVISGAIAASSYLFGMIKTISVGQAITAILIAATFSVIAFGLGRLVEGVKGVDPKSLIFLPIVMVLISLAIVGSSYVLSMIKPIGFAQAVTAILIAATFSVIAYGLPGLINAMNKIGGPSQAAKAVVLLPIILVGVSLAIMLSSYLFAGIVPISGPQFLTALGISIVFIPISFALPFIAKAVENINLTKIVTLPLIMMAMAAAILGASLLFQYIKPIDPGLLFNIVLIAATVAIVSIAMSFAIFIINKLNLSLGSVIKGGICIIIIAGAIAVSSLILSMGTYKNAPPIGWAVAFAFALLILTPAVILLGLAGLPIVAMGAIGLVIMAAAITAASYILSYVNPDFFLKVADAIKYFVEKMADAIGYALKVIAPGLKIFLDTVGDSLVRFLKNILPVLINGVKMLMDNVVKPFIKFIMPFLPIIVDLAIKLVKALIPPLEKVIDFFKFIFDSLNQMFKTFKDIIVAIGDALSKVINTIGDAITKSLEAIAKVIKAIGEAISGVLKSIGQIIKDYFSGFSMVIKAIGDSITNIVKSISGGIKEALDGIKRVVESIGKAISSVIDSIGNSFAKIGNSIATVINSVVGGIERLERVGTLDLAASALKIGEFLIAVTGYVATFTSKKYDFTNFNNIRWLFESVTNLTKSFGTTDPFVKISNSLDTFLSKLSKLKISKENPFKQLAEGVDSLVSSLNNLNTQVDIEKMAALNNLTGSVVMLSLMDPEQFKKVMDALEEKSSVLLSVMDKVSEQSEKSSSTKTISTTVKTTGGESSESKTLGELLSVMQRVERRLSSIERSNDNVSKYVNEIRSGDVKIK